MRLDLVTPPASEPVTVEEAKGALRVTHSRDDDRLGDAITAARQYFEEHTGRQVMPAVWRARFDYFPYFRELIRLPRPPLTAVNSIQYIDPAGAEQVWPAAEYVAEFYAGPYAERGSIRPANLPNLICYPTTLRVPNAIQVEFNAGYSSVPGGVKMAILKLVGGLYEEPGDTIVGAMVADNPVLIRLLDSFRIPVLA